MDYATRRSQQVIEDGSSADAMGMIGWGILGGMNVFNFLYYGDLYYQRYIMGMYDAFDGLSFKTVWGATTWFRTMLHVVVSFAMMILWCFTFFPWSGFWYMFYYVSVYFYTTYYFVRTFLLVLFQCVAFIADDFDKSFKYLDYFQQQLGMGHEQSDNAEELQWEEYKLEAANVLTAILAVPMLATGMRFWYLDEDERVGRFAEDRTQGETVPAAAETNNRLREASNVLFNDMMGF